MSRRVLGTVVALMLAAFGTVALVAYVRGAEDRALADVQLAEVYVVERLVPAGTAGEDLADFVRVDEVPEKVRPANAVVSLEALAGRVASVDLLVGEQLLSSRFIERTEFVNRSVGVTVPDGLVEITIRLDAERAVGGLITPGETVAVVGSFEPFDVIDTTLEIDGEEIALPDAVVQATAEKTPNTTGILLQKVLVTALQESQDNAGFGSDEDENRLVDAPRGYLLVTLAVTPEEAERIVFTAEFGLLYLAAERSDVPEATSPVQDRGNIYGDKPEDS